ncbi:MAG: NADH-quinone oxidoreductase subunit N [Gemmataceae bacterium]
MLPSVGWSQLQNDLLLFLPEAVVCCAIVALLLIRLVAAFDRTHLGLISLVAVVTACIVAFLGDSAGAVTFGGLLVGDPFTRFARLLILGTSALTILLSLLTGIPDREDSGDFYVLLLGGTLGMLFMASANHLLMAYIAVEMASLPSYALAGFLKGKRQGSEAALKYVVYGGGASGVMLYGISLIAGKFGTGYLPDLAKGYEAVLTQQSTSGVPDAVLVLGTLLILVGLSFKLSVVPFHFWCPDVFEGAAAEVAAFLSVASKAGAFALTGRLLLALASPAGADGGYLLARYFGAPLAGFAMLTATFGNLAAYAQTNMKRLLAYSTIAHAGYMLAGVATLTPEGAQSVLFYLATYAFMNMGAFAVVAFVRNKTGSEDITAYRGLIYRSPGVVVVMGIFLLSLLGLPPLAGFVAKFQVFAAIFHAGQSASASPTPWLGTVYYTLLVVVGINTVFSAVYYLRVLKTMIFDKPLEAVEGQPVPALTIPVSSTAYAGLLAIAVFVLGVIVDPVTAASRESVQPFRKREAIVVTPPAKAKGKGRGDGPAKGQNKGGPAKGQLKAPAKSKEGN